MDTLEKTTIEAQVHRALQQMFPGAQIEVDHGDGGEKVSGYVVWDGFGDESILERQTALYKRLNDALGEQARRVSLIFTYTPKEFALMNSV